MGLDAVDIRPVSDPVPLAGSIAEIYHSALGTLPDPPALGAARDWAAFSVPRHAARADFRCFGAFGEDRLVGFIYGYHGGRGEYWEDWLADLLAPELYERWIGDHWGITEFHVQAQRHGQGIGTRLYDALFSAPLPYPRAVLSTRNGDTPARRFYEHRGWRLIAELTDRYSLMGQEPVPQTGGDVSPSGRSGVRRACG